MNRAGFLARIGGAVVAGLVGRKAVEAVDPEDWPGEPLAASVITAEPTDLSPLFGSDFANAVTAGTATVTVYIEGGDTCREMVS